MLKCSSCGWPRINGYCLPEPWNPPKMPTAAYCAAVVLKNPSPFYRKKGTLDSDGTGRLKVPRGGWVIDGDPARRYAEECAARGHVPSAGALRGRNWKTGKIGECVATSNVRAEIVKPGRIALLEESK